MAFVRRPVRYYSLATRRRIRILGVPGQPFAIAHGHSFTMPPDEMIVEQSAGTVRRIFGHERATGRIAKLWPPYCKTVKHRGEQYQILAAATDAEIAEARRFLAAHHPQGAAPQGMLVNLYLLRDDASPPRLVGVAQIGEYYHTHFPGRAAFGRPMLGAGYNALGRGAVVKRIGLAAAKRFAIAAKRRGGGLGELLARHVLVIARDHRWPPARVVEVSRYQEGSKFLDVCCNRATDFLTRSAYVPVPLPKWFRKGRFDAGIAVVPGPQDVPGYYYADLTSDRRIASIVRALAATG